VHDNIKERYQEQVQMRFSEKGPVVRSQFKHKRFKMGALQVAKEKIKNIPTLPAIVIQIIKTTNDPTSSARDLNKILINDQAIAAKILQMANSPFYGLSSKVNNLNRGITLLGFNTVRSLALSISMVDHFKGKSSSEHFNRGRFWEHSLGVAMLAKMLASKQTGVNPEEAYMSGLLHDLGIIIMDQFFQDEFSDVMKLVHEKGMDLLDAEKEVWGLDHAHFAGEIAEAWKYPDFLVITITHHHNPGYKGEHQDIANIVCLANSLEYCLNEHEEKWIPELESGIMARLIPDEEQMEILKVKFEAETERHRGILKLFQ
jgi:putative nucleotidyltransferase with HDIG domain